MSGEIPARRTQPDTSGNSPHHLTDSTSPLGILAEVQADRLVVQDFKPLAESLEWELGQLYLRERGNQAFIGDAEPVPWIINNDGNLSINAAEVFFTSLLSAERDGTLEPDIFVLELGIGVGLFARFFLDHLRELCARHGKEFYDRLIYVAADRSPRMLRDAGRHGVFAKHAGRYVLRVADALCPEQTLAKDPVFGGSSPRPFRAVFLNYLLDCLPAAVLRVANGVVSQLCVRTCVARKTDLREFDGMRIEEIHRLVASADPADRRELLAVYPALVAQYDFRPVDTASIPYGDFAVWQAELSGTGSVLHSHGAIQSLERLLGLVKEDGFVLMNDYGATQVETTGEFEHQRFSLATFVGVNFPLLRSYFTASIPDSWTEPNEEGASIHARLVGTGVAPEVVTRFHERFGKTARTRLESSVQRARDLAKHGRMEAAISAYREVLEQQPYNWTLMIEVANFLAFPLGRPVAGLAMAKAALACNPACSADLLNTLGDCLYALKRSKEARQAFEQALRIRPEDVRARYNLSIVHAQVGEYCSALQRIAEALGLDKALQFREGLLSQQSAILDRLTQKNRVKSEAIADRVGRAPDSGERRGNSSAS
jgi:tetratricopeptide (TPR) repeat protein